MLILQEFFLYGYILGSAFVQIMGLCVGLFGAYFIGASIYLFYRREPNESPLIILGYGIFIALIGLAMWMLGFTATTEELVENRMLLGLQSFGFGVMFVVVYALVDLVVVNMCRKFQLEDTIAILVPSFGIILIFAGIGTMINACLI
jgi:hypothetical protein